MTEIPAVAPVAAPAAPAPAAPAVAPVAVTPPAAAPAVAPVVPVVAPADDSLLPAEVPAAPAVPQTEAEKLAAAQELVKQAAAAADPNSGKAWLLTDGVMGEGEKPGWLNTAKYKSVAAQAEAYSHLESRFGAFTGAPKEGYKLNLPEGVPGDMVNKDGPLFSEFTKWAGENQVSQEGFNQLLGYLVKDVASRAPKMSEIRSRLGEKADDRIAAVANWGKANLGAEGYQALRLATNGVNAGEVFAVLEQVIAKTAQMRMPKPGADVPGGTGADGLAAINTAMGVKDANGKLRIHNDAKYRAECDKRYQDYFKNQEAA